MALHFLETTAPRIAVVAALLALTGCADLPPDYSPHYSRVLVVDPARPDRVRYVTAPDACLTPDATERSPLGPVLPPGCANAYNLQRMTERESDLYYGRRMGAAPAAPTVRAAQKYLNGEEGPRGGAVGTGANTVSAPRPSSSGGTQ